MNLEFGIFLLLFYLQFQPILAEIEWDFYDDEDLALSIPSDANGAPRDFRRSILKEMKDRQKPNDIPKNRCYCSDGPEICGNNSTCIKHDNAACYYSVKEIYDKEEKRVITWHQYGCARLERGSGASHFICNAWRTPFKRPQSIVCCYEGNYCNKDLKPKPYAKIFHHKQPVPINGTELAEPDLDRKHPGIEIFVGIGIFCVILIVIIIVLCVVFRPLNFLFKKRRLSQVDNTDDTETGSTYIEEEKNSLLLEYSGSGSGKATLIQRTIRQDLTIISNIGQGRYGEVRKASYRGSCVAVKTFYTMDEDSWRNEKDVYQTNMINHENILQFVAADIWSEEDSMTKMLLVTDYHELGSLSDYLSRDRTIRINEALNLIFSCICGIEHLHTAVQGTGTHRKPEIAHRDIKSKNIIVKRPGVCCIADLGLALRCEDNKIIPQRFKVQVGTKRYMAPEILSQTINPLDFSQFKMADIYSMALVMWEVAFKVDTSIHFSSEDIGHNDRSESSGFDEDESSASDEDVHIDDQQTSNEVNVLKVKPYNPPYEGIVGMDPSMEEMRITICEKGLRPPIDKSWENDTALKSLSRLMQYCWHRNPQYRHTALKLKMEMKKLKEQIEEENRHNQKISVSKGETSKKSDSGIKSGNSLTS